VTAFVSSFVSTGSAWREIPAAEALRRARLAAPLVGITRITDITRLDRIDFPCAVAVRPDAMPGSLCVTAGKGLTITDALVGAAMEGIELAWAEPGRSPVRPVMKTAHDVLDGRERPRAILDFAPRLNSTIDLDAPYPCVWAEDLGTGGRVLVPAEAVFFPMNGPGCFLGATTNGLASGSSVAEATLHGLAECIERDAFSFNRLQNPPRIDAGTLPEPLRSIDLRLHERGLETWYFDMRNPFGVPCIGASLYDHDDRRMIHGGQGCHASPAIAAARALTEAIQSRLSIIHGGRDDITHIVNQQPPRSWEQMRAFFEGSQQKLAEVSPLHDFAGIPDLSAACAGIAEATAVLRKRLADQGMPWVLRVVLTPPDFPVAVVRVIVPRLECRTAADPTKRGPRLRDFMKGLTRYP
jgi:ribosomal protein S12 methylthiotransferase accessory factor